MLLTSVRLSPCRARLSRSSSGRSTSSSSPSRRTVMGKGRARFRVPLGPLTVTSAPSMVMSTPEGTGMGAWPMRLTTHPPDLGDSVAGPLGPRIRSSCSCSSPDEAQDLAAHAALPGFAIGHEPCAGGEHGDTEASEHAGHLVGLRVHAQARLGHALDAGDDARPLRRVLHLDGERAAGTVVVVGDGETGDVALLLEQARKSL